MYNNQDFFDSGEKKENRKVNEEQTFQSFHLNQQKNKKRSLAPCAIFTAFPLRRDPIFLTNIITEKYKLYRIFLPPFHFSVRLCREEKIISKNVF